MAVTCRRMEALAAVLALLCIAACLPSLAAAQADQATRTKLAAQVGGLNMVFLEGQRAGKQPADGADLYGSVWSTWKQEAYLNVCPTLQQQLSPEAAQALKDYPGYFEAGNTVVAVGPTSFGIAQVALGALLYDSIYAGVSPDTSYLNSKGCVTTGMAGTSLQAQLVRQLTFAANSIAAKFVKSSDNPQDFVMITSISDQSTYQDLSPTWLSPLEYQDKCYVADASNAAADYAAQGAAALSLISKYLKTVSSDANVAMFETAAARAYEYAKAKYIELGYGSACTTSSANRNCIGSCTQGFASVCELYFNGKGAQQHMFYAAAAMYYNTGEGGYRSDADSFYDYGTFKWWINWNNVYALGMALLSLAPDAPGSSVSQGQYIGDLKTIVRQWSECSNNGQSGGYCKRTGDGNAYPVDLPWGNLGISTSAVCMAGVIQKVDPDSTEAKDASCFMHRQLGFLTNHKCGQDGYSCNTPDDEGFSYIAGLGKHFPTKIHSREVSDFQLLNDGVEDKYTLCGALVSGPWAQAGGTDFYGNRRTEFRESEAAVDYSGAIICAFGAYASLPDGGLDGCNVARSPFDGR